MKTIFAILISLAAWTSAAIGDEPRVEVHFRDAAQVSGRVVLLSDVADIDGSDKPLITQLGATELVATPSKGQTRSLRQRELIDHIQLNGFNLRQISFSGASITQVSTGAIAKKVKPTAPTSGRMSAAQRRITQVVTAYLRTAHPEVRRSSIDVVCGEPAITAASSSAASISVVNAEPNATDGYDVIIAVSSRGELMEFTVQANASAARHIVVAARALRPGAVLGVADLKLAVAKSDVEEASAVSSIEDVLGQELTRAVAADQIIPMDQITAPRLVRKGELVEITARAGGVRVTTQGIAQEDGSLGQLISLEPSDSRLKPGQKNKDFIRAKVTAAGHVQVDAGGLTKPASRIGSQPVRSVRR